MTPVLPTTCGRRCMLDYAAAINTVSKYYGRYTEPFIAPIDVCIRSETGNFFQKRKSCGAVCVRKIKGGNFKVAVKPISPQTSNHTTSYVQDRVFPILDKSYATQAVQLWLLIIILLFYEWNALRLVSAVKILFSTLSYTWPLLCYLLFSVQSTVVDRLPQAEPSQFW